MLQLADSTTTTTTTEPLLMMNTAPNYVLGVFVLSYVLCVNVLATAIMLRIYTCRKKLGVAYQVQACGFK